MWNIFKKRPHFFSAQLLSRTLTLRFSASQAPTMRSVRSSHSLFKYSDLPAIFECSTWNIFKKNPLRHYPFDFSILVRSKNSLYILDSNRQELFFFARLVVRNLTPWLSQAPNAMRRLKDQLLLQCSNVPRGTFLREAF